MTDGGGGTAATDRDVVRRWVRAANDGDLERMLEIADPEIEMSEASALPGAARVNGLKELETYLHGWNRNWSRTEWLEEELLEVSPGRVLLEATLRLTGLRSGITVEHRWTYVFTIRDGRVLRQDGYDSRDEAMAALR